MPKVVTIKNEQGMSDARYRMALVRMRDRIKQGLKLNSIDSTTVGDKFTHCSWGLCSEDVGQWPHAGDHTFPLDFVDRQRVSPNRQEHQTCPFQTNADEPGATSWGCFYKCRIFQGPNGKERKRGYRISKSAAIELYNQRIKAVGELPEVCACEETRHLCDSGRPEKVIECPDCTAVMKK